MSKIVPMNWGEKIKKNPKSRMAHLCMYEKCVTIFIHARVSLAGGLMGYLWLGMAHVTLSKTV
jgi:hypothetical protein